MPWETNRHAEQVEAWIKEVTPALSSEQVIQLFDLTLKSLWMHAQTQSSTTVLKAILERVIFNLNRRYYFLELIELTQNGAILDALYKSPRKLDRADTLMAFQLVITDFMALLGALTNDVVSPDLHRELLKIKLDSDASALPPVTRPTGEETELNHESAVPIGKNKNQRS
jgi:hypothetical protein